MVVPDGGPCRIRSCGKAGTIDVSRYEVVCPWQVTFAFSTGELTGELTGGCVGTKLLVLPSVRLSVFRARCPVCEDYGA